MKAEKIKQALENLKEAYEFSSIQQLIEFINQHQTELEERLQPLMKIAKTKNSQELAKLLTENINNFQ